MLNEVNETRMKLIDYKSIALPAELQGHMQFFNIIYGIIKYFFLNLYNGKLLKRYLKH